MNIMILWIIDSKKSILDIGEEILIIVFIVFIIVIFMMVLIKVIDGIYIIILIDIMDVGLVIGFIGIGEEFIL